MACSSVQGRYCGIQTPKDELAYVVTKSSVHVVSRTGEAEGVH
jgi:hypothetical protein